MIGFPQRVKDQAWKRAGGFCETGDKTDGRGTLDGCGMPLAGKGRAHADHILPRALQGKDTLDNCQILCTPCHNRKTVGRDRPAIDKAERIKAKHEGRWRSRWPMKRR